jgi:hypothetical protein
MNFAPWPSWEASLPETGKLPVRTASTQVPHGSVCAGNLMPSFFEPLLGAGRPDHQNRRIRPGNRVIH